MRFLTILWLALILSLAMQPASAFPDGVAGILQIGNLPLDGLIGATSDAAFLPAYSFSSSNLTAHILDVGQGDSILVQFKGKNILIDGGEKEMGTRVESDLRHYGVSRIDLMVATHPHSDHIGGLLEILDRFQVLKVLDSGQPHTSKTYEDFLTKIDQKDIPYQVADAGQRIDLFPGIDIEVLSPPAGRLGDDLNQNSIVLRIVYGKVAFLLMGDAGVEAEKEILSKGFEVRSDMLKVGHHGSKSATGASFLKRVDPGVSIISAGIGNPYGHPAAEIVKRLEKSGTMVYRTDLQGTVDVTTDGTAVFVSAQGKDRAAKAAAA